jgi:hypothetical protein
MSKLEGKSTDTSASHSLFRRFLVAPFLATASACYFQSLTSDRQLLCWWGTHPPHLGGVCGERNEDPSWMLLTIPISDCASPRIQL